MTEETTTPQPSRQLAALQAGGAVRAIVPNDFDSTWRIATAIVKAGMAPAGLETIEKCTIAIMHGLEVGLTPMAALQSIALINGRPTIFGDGALGLCQGSGKMEWHKEFYEGTEGKDDFTAHCHAKRLGDPEIKYGKFSVSDAKVAKLWGKAGPWTQYSRRMLQMRARAFALRDGFSDVLKGLGIAEEVRDTPMKDVTPPPPDIDGVQDKPIPPVAGQSTPPAATPASSGGAPPDIDFDEPVDGKPDPTAAAAQPAGAAGETRTSRQTQAAGAVSSAAASAEPRDAQIPLDGEIIPPRIVTKLTKDGHSDFLDFVGRTLDKVMKAGDLEIVFNDEIGPRMDEISKDHHPDVYALYRKHEIRLGID